MPRVLVWFMTIVVLFSMTVVSPAAQVVSQVVTAKLVRTLNVPNMSDVKYPDVLGVDNTVYVAGSSGTTSNREARFVPSNHPFETFGSSTGMGNADGQSDYSPSVMASGPDGSLYFVWLRAERGSRGIFLRRKAPNEDWGPQRTVISDEIFRVRVDVAVTSDNRIYVVWDENSRYRYRTSTDGGANWSGTQLVSEDPTSSRPFLAPDSNGGMWVTFSLGGGDSTAGDIKAGLSSNGGSFSMQYIFGDNKDNYSSDPTITVSPNGTVYTAWRVISGGIYYAERQANGSWANSRLVSGLDRTAFGTVSIVSDRTGNLHLAWGGNTEGNFDIWYAFKPLGANWQGPIKGTDDADLDANISLHWTINDAAYGHVVGERFTDDGLLTRYTLFSAPTSECTGTLALNGEATRNSRITGTITPSSGCTPTQMQLSLNTPPTASSPDRIAYSPNVTIDIPADQIGASCTQTVYAHLYKDGNSTFNSGSIFADTITVDPSGDVDATVIARNPNISGRGPVYTPLGSPDVRIADAGYPNGASNGDPAWSRSLQFYLNVKPDGDCSGISSFVIGSDTTSLQNGEFAGVMALPYPAATPPGLKPFDVVVTDGVGNAKIFPQGINYDPVDDPTNGVADESGRPVFSTGEAANDNSSATARKSIIRTLTLNSVNVTDNLYRPSNAGSQYWGLWVANAPRNVANPDLSTLQWTPVPVASPGATISVQWNIFNYGDGPRLDREGSYTVFVKVLDGAGNASTRTVSTTFTLDPGYTLPTQRLPLVVR